MPTIQYVNQETGGFLEQREVPEGTTSSQFFQTELPDANPDEFTIEVDRDMVTGDHILQEGQRVSVAPVKVAGA